MNPLARRLKRQVAVKLRSLLDPLSRLLGGSALTPAATIDAPRTSLEAPLAPSSAAKALTLGPTTAAAPSGFVAERMVETCVRLFDELSAHLERETRWSAHELERCVVALEKCANHLWTTSASLRSADSVDLRDLRVSYERLEALIGPPTSSPRSDPREEQVAQLMGRLVERPPEDYERRDRLRFRLREALSLMDRHAAFLGHPETVAGFDLEALRRYAKEVPPPPVNGHPFTTSWAGEWARVQYFGDRYQWVFPRARGRDRPRGAPAAARSSHPAHPRHGVALGGERHAHGARPGDPRRGPSAPLEDEAERGRVARPPARAFAYQVGNNPTPRPITLGIGAF